MPAWALVAIALAYLLLLFAIAWWGDRHARGAARGLVGSPTVYALSLAVFCTTWTFYGSVGRAASIGLGFLPIYLGPTLAMILGMLLLRKIVLVARTQRIASIADFIAARYGRSHALGGLVAALAVIVIIPYIALQLKAVSVSFELLTGLGQGTEGKARPFLLDTAFHTTLLMAAFTILFGARQMDAAEHHPGVVIAVAFESVVKLAAFLALGTFVVFGLFEGPGDLFAQARALPEMARLLTADPLLEDGSWITATVLALLAIICLPRQFQMLVVENTDERHLPRAMWLFPLYLLLINIFVLPVALAGLVLLPDPATDRDMVVLALPLVQGWTWLAVLVFIGGLSAAAGMIVVETIALSTMVSNNLVIPTVLRRRLAVLAPEQGGSPRLPVLAIRRVAIVVILLLGYAYFRLAGEAYALVAIGLISFAGVAQFAPALVGGLFWAGATRRGAIMGLMGGALVWGYTLLLPSFARSGWLPQGFLVDGPWGVELLRPYALLGLEGLDPLTHSLFWSALANIGLFVGVSLFDRAGRTERAQAIPFVEALHLGEPPRARGGRTGTGLAAGELTRLLRRLLGRERARAALTEHAASRGIVLDPDEPADGELVLFAERLLTGVIGATSARVALTSLSQGGAMDPAELLRMLDEASEVIEYSRRLEQKSAELEQASAALRAANERLRELDRLKDDFLSTVTHELRTPLTAVRSFAEILYDDPDLDLAQRQEFLALVIRESERLTRLINQLLDMAKIEAGAVDWQVTRVDLRAVVEEAVASTGQIFRDNGVVVATRLPPEVPPVQGDHDRLMQVLVNLLANAAKFAPARTGRVEVTLDVGLDWIELAVRDNGRGIPAGDLEAIFDKFRQSGEVMTDRPAGTGLGLSICRRIVEHVGGRIWAESRPGEGATFRVRLPVAAPAAQDRPGGVPLSGMPGAAEG
ncbi:sensor histidine kinase [Sabulicella glaciei]|uniref:histidine kinase n=1 Tax=Sabulicella glaciei TaxID=2984948 RepID=A0ABT3NU82_9PROT|nr:sensor histidine kinase [Roseococcus sp. MDT2-1-1]MCW8085722.1 sensor histidine kinase [Roseococcus sp. MDT2-1-1]